MRQAEILKGDMSNLRFQRPRSRILGLTCNEKLEVVEPGTDAVEIRAERQMKRSDQSRSVDFGKSPFLFCRHAVFAAILAICCLGLARPACAQVVYSGDAGGFTLSAGGAVSGYKVQYGQEKLLGATGFVDVDTRRRFGIEAEAHWLVFHQTNQEQATLWLLGPRYHFSHGKFQYYGKGLVGLGQFTYPYNYGHDSDLIVGGGGGVDYRWRHRISLRLGDFEYQYWPQFHYGAMGTYGISVGAAYHIR